ncbi:MAG: hypothetical protein ACYCUF_07910 [Acidimicrobiales bacterium]|jgi:hypothetical protein|nr:hypothetical protein [Actinomycetota bacterium]MDA8183053.1 hypothetical protein [Actinomycetota bacterium]
MLTLDDLLDIAPVLDGEPGSRVGTLVATCRPPVLQGRCAQRLPITADTTFADVASVLARRAHVRPGRSWKVLLDEGWVVASGPGAPGADGSQVLPATAPIADVMQPCEPIVVEWDSPYSPDWHCTFYPEAGFQG